MSDQEQSWLEGLISIEAALAGDNRPIYQVYVQQGKWDRKLQRLKKTAESRQIPWQTVTADFIDTRTGGQSHGGVVAEVGPRRFLPLAGLLPSTNVPFIAMLDGIEDPFNFGQAIRALYAAGADGLVVRPRNWLSAAGIVARASAGTAELMPMAVAETSLEAATFFRQHGLAIACTSDKGATSLYEADLTGPLFLLIGGERRGITRSFLDQADLKVQIPYGRSFSYSLGAAAATAVISFEVARQRRKTPGQLPGKLPGKLPQ
jgi:23S rRNA (guanosine2251-2'-O)-methyltransferase